MLAYHPHFQRTRLGGFAVEDLVVVQVDAVARGVLVVSVRGVALRGVSTGQYSKPIL